MHELGHLMEFADHLVNDELTKLRLAFRAEIARAYWVAGSVANKAAFIQQYGSLINLRQTLKTWTPGHKPVSINLSINNWHGFVLGRSRKQPSMHFFTRG